MSEKYTCALCKGVFEKTVPEDEALAELKEFFGDISVDECDIVCDDCWQKIRPDKHMEKLKEQARPALLLRMYEARLELALPGLSTQLKKSPRAFEAGFDYWLDNTIKEVLDRQKNERREHERLT
ncbi:hypothetical protein KAR91_23155 [Candidatus Pacearchaeota archaeon]|nr:hypothetical protein [Candidatus Pacearchaeota archaeon]